MDDGVVLRAHVFRPVADGKYPVIMSYGPSIDISAVRPFAPLTNAAPAGP